MSKRVSYIITDSNITVNYDGQTHIVPRKDSLADRLIEAIRGKNLDEIPRLVSVAKRVVEFGQGNFSIENNRIMINGVAAPDVLSRKIMRFMNEGLPAEPLIKFAEHLLKNPSFRAVNELFQFLEKNDHPITDNGCFIAYKKVRADFKDAYTGTLDNSPGMTVEIPRNQVNEDPTVTCSYGLHVANWDYAHNVYPAGEGANMLEVEVNPADVVAVPIDYNQAKMRVSRYVVLGTVDQEHSTETALRTTREPCGDCGSPTCTNEPAEMSDCCECGDSNCDGYECEEEENRYCSQCDDELLDSEDDICDDCVYDNEIDDGDKCLDCGALLSSEEGDICDECDAEDQDTDDVERPHGNHDDEDRYPWEDELDEEE
jgi:hypothetical protein